jgi:hypothetical protein
MALSLGLAASLAPASAHAQETYTMCARQGGTCKFTGKRNVRYGVSGKYVTKTFTGSVGCNATAFGSDPAPRSWFKTCSYSSLDQTPAVPTPVPTPVPTTPTPSTGVQRPSYNKGSGFFVANGKLYDAKGNEFRVRGTNKVHWDNTSPGLNNTKSNTTRWNIDFTRRPADNVALLQSPNSGGTIAHQQIVMPSSWVGTCKGDTATFNGIVDTWVQQAASWNQLEKQLILNIANEWGPSDSTVWRDANIDAIKRLRAAGVHATIAVTAGGCGQDAAAILKYGKAVFDSDPEQNVIFDQHVYGAFKDVAGGEPGQYDDQVDLDPHFKALAATGLVVVIGEFGPGRNIGPSPTNIKPERVMELAEKYNLGWLAWAWDDNDQANAMSSDNWFGMSYTGGYTKSSDLTIFGRTVIENPTWGLNKLGKPATIFQ